MAIATTDSMGPYFDTGVSTVVTARTNVEREEHTSREIDTGSTTAPTAESGQHIPHRDLSSPR